MKGIMLKRKVTKIRGLSGLILRKFGPDVNINIVDEYMINFGKNFELTKRENRLLLNKWHFPNLNIRQAVDESLRLEILFLFGIQIQKLYVLMGNTGNASDIMKWWNLQLLKYKNNHRGDSLDEEVRING
ncbi:MAG: hypothetical protein ACRC0Y_04725 [Fusobacteriaceae bacterium]